MSKINIITRMTFSKYGSLLKAGISEYAVDGKESKHIELKVGKTNELWCFDSDVYLEQEDGVGLLYIMDDNGGLQCFILDRPVSINSGIRFCILPYASDFIFNMISPEKMEAYKLGFTLTPTGIYPVISLGEIYTLLYQEKEKGYIFKGEKHKSWELTYVDKGDLCNVADNIEYPMSQGELMFFAGNQYHSQYTKPENRASFLTISFDLTLEYPQMLTNRVFKVDNEQREILKRILKEYNREEPYSADMITAYLLQLIVLVIRQQQFERNSGIDTAIYRNTKSKIVNDCLFAVEKKLYDSFSLSELAEEVCVSPAYLSKIFRRETGESLFAYIKKRKFEVAKDMIMDGKYTISQVSNSLGFCSVQYFSSEFKKEFGVSPIAYARAIQ